MVRAATSRILQNTKASRLATALPIPPPMGPSVIVIARSEQAAGLRKRLAPDSTVALFSDAESLKALAAVLGQAPRILALDRTFAATARGAALVRQVKGREEHANATEIRVLAEDENNQPLILSSRIASVESVMRASHPLDYCGTRRALRFDVIDRVQLAVNGERGRLVNLSFAGAQVVLPVRIRPEEALRITLTEAAAEDDTRARGVVAWCTVEPKGPFMIYRAGVEFTEADTRRLEDLCIRYGSAAHRTGE
jgi:PilZ domain-containing protein